MASGKKRQTFEKMNRERRVREKRALKAEKREQRKLAASLEANPEAQDPDAVGEDAVEPARDGSEEAA